MAALVGRMVLNSAAILPCCLIVLLGTPSGREKLAETFTSKLVFGYDEIEAPQQRI